MKTIESLNLANSSEISILIEVRKRLSDKIDFPFRNKGNAKKYTGKPLIIEKDGMYYHFYVHYTPVMTGFNYILKEGKFSNKRTIEDCCYLQICKTATQIKKEIEINEI